MSRTRSNGMLVNCRSKMSDFFNRNNFRIENMASCPCPLYRHYKISLTEKLFSTVNIIAIASFFNNFFARFSGKGQLTYNVKFISLPFVWSKISEVKKSWFCNNDSSSKRLCGGVILMVENVSVVRLCRFWWTASYLLSSRFLRFLVSQTVGRTDPLKEMRGRI